MFKFVNGVGRMDTSTQNRHRVKRMKTSLKMYAEKNVGTDYEFSILWSFACYLLGFVARQKI